MLIIYLSKKMFFYFVWFLCAYLSFIWERHHWAGEHDLLHWPIILSVRTRSLVFPSTPSKSRDRWRHYFRFYLSDSKDEREKLAPLHFRGVPPKFNTHNVKYQPLISLQGFLPKSSFESLRTYTAFLNDEISKLCFRDTILKENFV